MKRDEIIKAIEKMRVHGVTDQWRAEFESALHQESQKRSALADDFHRAIVYSFILFTRAGYLNKERRQFLRPTKRAVLLTLALVVTAFTQVVVLAVLLEWMDFERVYMVPIVVIVLLFELGFVISKGNEMIGADRSTGSELLRACSGCDYDLTAHDSVLDDEIWVGPERCPECGRPYPAVP